MTPSDYDTRCCMCGDDYSDESSCEICGDDVCEPCMDDHVEEYHGTGGDEL